MGECKCGPRCSDDAAPAPLKSAGARLQLSALLSRDTFLPLLFFYLFRFPNDPLFLCRAFPRHLFFLCDEYGEYPALCQRLEAWFLVSVWSSFGVRLVYFKPFFALPTGPLLAYVTCYGPLPPSTRGACGLAFRGIHDGATGALGAELRSSCKSITRSRSRCRRACSPSGQPGRARSPVSRPR